MTCKSNMDIQYIKEESCSVGHYIGKYATKPEKSNLDIDFQTSVNSTRSKLFSLAIKGISKREVGSIEAADSNLGLWLTKIDPHTHIKWVNTCPDKKQRIKPIKFLQDNPDSTEYFYPDDVNNRYNNRPETMNDVNLFDYISLYDNVPVDRINNPDVIKLENDAGHIRKRSKPALISHMRYDKMLQPENYYRNLLLLFKPWRKREDVLQSYNTFSESFIEEAKNNTQLREYEQKISLFVQKRKHHDDKVRECLSTMVEDDDVAPETVECSEKF